jgi:putative hydrolase of the HAD superfamily
MVRTERRVVSARRHDRGIVSALPSILISAPKPRAEGTSLNKVVIWDFDGTLARRAGGWSGTLVEVLDLAAPGHCWTSSSFMPGLSHGFPWHEWQQAHPELADPDLWWAHLKSLLRSAMEEAGVDRPLAERATSLFRSQYVRIDRWSAFPEALPALDRLRRAGWRHAILSNHCPELPDLVAGLGFSDRFDLVLTSAAIGFEKPHPEAFARAIVELGHPERVWMVGDSPQADIAGAAAQGIPGVLVRRPEPGMVTAPDLLAASEIIEPRGLARPANDSIDAEMIRYYAARADEYDDWYLRLGRYSHGPAQDQAWRSDLAAATAWLDGLPFRGRIADLAAGTGWWSPTLAKKGDLTLYDAAAEPLALATARLEPSGLVARTVVRDAWEEPHGVVDGLFTGFWLSHVERARLDEFFERAARWLASGGLFAFIDSSPDADSGARDHRPPERDVQIRKLDDGTSFRVRKVFYEAETLRAAMQRAGFGEIEITTTDRFFILGSARKR